MYNKNIFKNEKKEINQQNSNLNIPVIIISPGQSNNDNIIYIPGTLISILNDTFINQPSKCPPFIPSSFTKISIIIKIL